MTPRLLKCGQRLLQFGAVVLAALAFSALVLVVAGAEPLSAFAAVVDGALGSWVRIAQVIKAWIPLSLCACGLLFTFRIGLWNIGVEGQVILGAICATAVLRQSAPFDAFGLMIGLALVGAATGGGLWALLAGWLKTRGGVNEIFAGLGLNFVAQGLTLWLIFGPWKRPGVASMSGTELFSENLWLYQSPGLRIAPTALLLALVAIAATAVILRFARFGLCLRAIGRNAFAAGLFGLHPARYMLLAMLVAGGMAGIAGGLQVVAVYHRLLPAISSNYGYLALLVVLLANDRIAAAVVASLVFAGLNVGAIQLPMALQLDSSLSGVIQGALVLATVALSARSQKPAAQS